MSSSDTVSNRWMSCSSHKFRWRMLKRFHHPVDDKCDGFARTKSAASFQCDTSSMMLARTSCGIHTSWRFLRERKSLLMSTQRRFTVRSWRVLPTRRPVAVRDSRPAIGSRRRWILRKSRSTWSSSWRRQRTITLLCRPAWTLRFCLWVHSSLASSEATFTWRKSESFNVASWRRLSCRITAQWRPNICVTFADAHLNIWVYLDCGILM